MAAPEHKTSPFENSLLEEAIADAWERQKNNASIDDVQAYLISQSNREAKKLGRQLRSFTKKMSLRGLF